jgi:hypothetical protein
MSYETPKESNCRDCIFAVVALLGCVLMCLWPYVMRSGLQWLGEHAKHQQASDPFENPKYLKN